jgi:NADH dehydrogenase
MNCSNIVLLGGGYTSIWAYKKLYASLRRKIKNGEVTITVISQTNYHSFHGFTGEVISGLLPLETRFTPLKRIMKYANVIVGEVATINAIQKHVQVKDYNSQQLLTIPYHHLVIGTGSRDNVQVAQGLKEFGYTVKTEGALQELQEKLIGLVEKYAGMHTEPAQRTLNMVVAGAGFAGVEICGNLCEYLKGLKKYYPALHNCKITMYLVNSGADILPELNGKHPRLVRYAKKCLRNYGVRIINNTRLTQITRQGAWLDRCVFIDSELVICASGQINTPFEGDSHLQYTTSNKVLTNEYLQAKSHSFIWAGGDAAQVMRCNGAISPSNALWAIKHGELIGKNIASCVQKKRLKKFTYPGLGQTACVGMGKGLLELYGIEMTGWLAWFNRLFFFLYFMPTGQQRIKAVLGFFHSFLAGRQLFTHHFYEPRKATASILQTENTEKKPHSALKETITNY